MSDAFDWLAVLERAVAIDPRGITGVAERIGYSRPAVSRALAGSYGDTTKLAAAVQRELVRIDCPHLATTITAPQCRDYASRSYTAITAADVPHWRACRRCAHKPPESSS